MRKIIQIITDAHKPIALCDDGTVWQLDCHLWEIQQIEDHTWTKLPDIPQTGIKF